MNTKTKPKVYIILLIEFTFLLIALLFLMINPIYFSLDIYTLQNMHPAFGSLFYFLIHEGFFIFGLLFFISLIAWGVILYRNKFKKEAFAFFGIILFFLASLIASEIGLWLLHYNPGYSQSNKWIEIVDEVEVLHGFEADTLGITKFPKQAIAYNRTMMLKASEAGTLDCCPLPDSLYTEAYETWKFYHEELLLEVQNDFSSLYKAIKEKDVWNSFDSLIMQYALSPINDDGFKSIPFDKTISNKKKVLLLGDSFTFGHHVKNISSGFADILLSKGYLCYNTGISGADIMQYYLIAKKYIPIIQPDIVILNAYLGNDLTTYYRSPEPYLPLYYTTNAGNLYTNIKGENYSDPNEIYTKILDYSKVTPKTWIGTIVCKTRIGTLLWNKFNPKQQQVSEYSTAVKEEFAYIKEVQEIQGLCKALNITFLLVSIPEFRNLQLIKAEAYPEFFNNFNYYEPNDLSPLDYVRNNGHFNEKGHEKYANFLESLLEFYEK